MPVELFAGKRLLARAEASKFRGDLRDANIGDGSHAFEFQLPADLFDGKLHELTVIAGGSATLKPAKVEFRADATLSDYAVQLESGALVVSALTRKLPSDSLQVWDGTRLVGQVPVEKGADGKLVIPLPYECLDGMPHHFSVRCAETRVLLGEVVTLTRALHAPDEILQKYSGSRIKAGLSPIAALRYEALRTGIADCLENASHGDQLAEEIRALVRAHEQVVRGFAGESRGFELLVFPHHDQPDVSIVMPVHNKFPVTYNGLASLLLARNKARFEVILVDDGSTDETANAPALIKGVCHVRHEAAMGFLRSCNDGAGRARGRYVVMLNNDVEVTNGWLDELIWPFEHFDKVGLVGSQLLYPDGKLQESGGVVWSSGAAWNYGRGGNPHEPRFNYTRQVDYVSGASIMLTRDLWNNLGGFDEEFAPAYYEDTDLAFRVREAGYKTLVAPLSRVIHFEGVSGGTSVASGVKKFQQINQPKFRARWAKIYRNNGVEASEPELVKDRNVHLRALLLDSQLPMPDRDAGSYAAVQEMRLLQSLGFKVTFASESLFYQGEYTEALQRMGVECLYAPYFPSLTQVLERRGSEFDLVYITRYSVAVKNVDAVRKWAPRAKIVLNNADLHFLREMRMALAAGDKQLMTGAVATRDAELAAMTRVDLVLSYNEVEHVVIMSHNLDKTRVAKCPWVVDLPRQVPAFADRVGVAYLGGFGHAPNIEAVEYFVGKVMPLLRKFLPGVKFYVYGSNVPESIRALECEDVIIKGYVKDVADVYDRCRVFVAPLLSGAGIKGKVIGALARGVPCVLSPVAAEGTQIRSGSEALIASNPREWVDNIARLHTDAKLWESVSVAGQKLAADLYSFDAGRILMQRALEAVEIFTDADPQAISPLSTMT